MSSFLYRYSLPHYSSVSIDPFPVLLFPKCKIIHFSSYMQIFCTLFAAICANKTKTLIFDSSLQKKKLAFANTTQMVYLCISINIKPKIKEVKLTCLFVMYYNVKVFGKQLTMCNTFVSVYQCIS